MEDDPAAPFEGELAPGLALERARALANGMADPMQHDFDFRLRPPLAIFIDRALAFTEACMSNAPRVHYALGAKAPSDDSQPGDPAPPGFTALDCSGFVRTAVRRSTDPEERGFPAGSVNQHDWVRIGFASGKIEDGELSDGRVRIAFLPPSATQSGIGHVVLLHEGLTLESHGGVGPDRRVWATLPWRVHTKVYALT